MGGVKKKEVFVCFTRLNDGWKIRPDEIRYMDAIEKRGIPDDKLGDELEATSYYVENDLGAVCNFYCE